MGRLSIFLIRVYQKTFSPDHGLLGKTGVRKTSTCVFYPTCSEYTIHAIEKYGVASGLYKGVKRVFRCHPWQKRHIDPLR
ncbi:MAG: membrane protein insertion efficiency factor YidD [Patescibacteria group bacterium]|nr:MAG: membrane protein insertion efficiency factor YidD [Patescibacteria group bacterium]